LISIVLHCVKFIVSAYETSWCQLVLDYPFSLTVGWTVLDYPFGLTMDWTPLIKIHASKCVSA